VHGRRQAAEPDARDVVHPDGPGRSAADCASRPGAAVQPTQLLHVTQGGARRTTQAQLSPPAAQQCDSRLDLVFIVSVFLLKTRGKN